LARIRKKDRPLFPPRPFISLILPLFAPRDECSRYSFFRLSFCLILHGRYTCAYAFFPHGLKPPASVFSLRLRPTPLHFCFIQEGGYTCPPPSHPAAQRSGDRSFSSLRWGGPQYILCKMPSRQTQDSSPNLLSQAQLPPRRHPGTRGPTQPPLPISHNGFYFPPQPRTLALRIAFVSTLPALGHCPPQPSPCAGLPPFHRNA